MGMDLGFSFGCLTLGCWFGFDCVVVRYYCCLLCFRSVADFGWLFGLCLL